MDARLPELDLPSALTLLGDAVSRAVLQALEGTGLRHGHGYLVQRLLMGPATASELADELGITQQAVSKTVNELLTLGHLQAVPDPSDRRRRPVRLTARGVEAVQRARAARAEIESRIRTALGDQRTDSAMADLLAMLSAMGVSEDVRRRAISPPGSEL